MSKSFYYFNKIKVLGVATFFIICLDNQHPWLRAVLERCNILVPIMERISTGENLTLWDVIIFSLREFCAMVGELDSFECAMKRRLK